MPQRTLANLLHEYLAPEQPHDCKAAILEVLGPALKAAGPVVHAGRVATATHEHQKWAVHLERRDHEKIPGPPAVNEDGETVEGEPRDPTDAELAEQWGLPLASDVPLTEAEAEAEEAAEEAPHRRGRRAHHDH